MRFYGLRPLIPTSPEKRGLSHATAVVITVAAATLQNAVPLADITATVIAVANATADLITLLS